MKFKQWLKTALAGTLAFAMVATSVPVDVSAVDTQFTEDLVLHWDMTTDEEGNLKDLTGNGHAGIQNGAVAVSTIDDIPVLDMTGGYVDIPDGTISEDATEVTINMLVKISQNIKSSWMFCLGSNNKKYMYITGSSNQDNNMRGGVGNAPASGNGWSYESVIEGKQPLLAGEWQNVTVTYVDGGDFTFYVNGAKYGSKAIADGNANNDTTCTLQGLLTAGDARDGYMGWSFYEANDPKFQGAVADFKIYERAMTEDEVGALYTEVNDTLVNLKLSDFGASNVDLTAEDCLPDGVAANEITVLTDLVLPTETSITVEEVTKEGVEVSNWRSSNTDLISDEGIVVRQPVEDTEVTMTADITLNGRTVTKALTFTVKGDDGAANRVAWDMLELMPNRDDIRGNIALPSTGKYGSSIIWSESSNEDVISTKQNGKVAPGKVTRQEEDTKVTLRAIVSYGKDVSGNVEYSDEEEIECTVKAKADIGEMTDYLFAYFPYTSTKDERIYFAISEDGTNFEALNDGKFVLESKLGTHGLRDPFVIRSPEGDKFYLIATDLTVAGISQDGVSYPGVSWDKNQTEGSQSIMVWESTDLVNWSDQRMCKVAPDDAGCTWAPEAYWDDETEQFVVFWASKAASDNNYGRQRVYYATTRDFYTFSEPAVWIEESGSVIDTTVIKAGDYYYRYTKNEDGGTNVYGTPSKRVYCERSTSLLGEWEIVHNNSLNVGGGQIEGACISAINPEDVETVKAYAAAKGITLEGDEIYCLSADQTGSTIFIGLSDDITDGWFNVLGTAKSQTVDGVSIYSMPEPDASHGTIMPITSAEYEALMGTYGTPTVEDVTVPEIVNIDYTEDKLPTSTKVVLGRASVDTEITWEVTGDFTQAGTVTLTGTTEEVTILGQ